MFITSTRTLPGRIQIDTVPSAIIDRLQYAMAARKVTHPPSFQPAGRLYRASGTRRRHLAAELLRYRAGYPGGPLSRRYQAINSQLLESCFYCLVACRVT